MISQQRFALAIRDFERAHTQARWEQFLARLRGEPTGLLCYDDARHLLKAQSGTSRGLQDIPIDAIVGSLGRCTDFTRSFLPLRDENKDRWVRVEMSMTGISGLPPIDVYQIGDAYFVLDGNHRVSVAKQLGATHIQAYVTEFHTKVPFSPDDQPDDLIIKAEYTEFLELTHLDELRPGADLSMSAPGRYRELEEHISVHRYFMGIEQGREIPYREAVAHWYDDVYMPVVHIIREQNILRDFPGRTETDLYLWIMLHRDELDQDLAWDIRPEVAADDLVDRSSPRLKHILNRVVGKIQSIIIPKQVASGPPPGEWRRERGVEVSKERLFTSVLVAINGQERGWYAVEQAVEVARREGGQLIGMHVVPTSPKEDQAIRATQQEFDRRCAEAGITAQWVLETGEIASKICERGRWLDLVVASLAYPPDDQPAARLESGFRALIQRCPTPLLAVPDTPSAMNRALLAYDGSPKAQEALFISTYLAGQWAIPLTVVTVLEQEHTTPKTIKRALKYLEEHGVKATFVEKRGAAIGDAILSAAAEQESDLIIMGGYGFSPVLQIVLGSAVDQVLRESRVPVLICR